MNDGIDVTGERLIEEQYRSSLGRYVIYLMHAASYRFAEKYCQGQKVLDFGCGSGYGAETIAKCAKEVHAVDVSTEAVEYARKKYARENLHFLRIQPEERLPFSDNSFDVVLSFQVIEHVENDANYMAEAERVLKDDGIFIVITPDRKKRLFPGQRPWNRWHLREYSKNQIVELVSKCFDINLLLKMGALPHVAAVEINRYMLLKWLTFPFTFPGSPEKWRQFGLNLIHRIKPQHHETKTNFDPEFGIESIILEPEVDNSLNLIVVAKPIRRNKSHQV